ncbi:MAG: DMT family transporter [Rhodobacteraceae bacterium]|nr:DMT family transporter [Paracoccaceae bacterium]MCY4197673.1 DMT family transporter [Paracoccaceae bacterium]MCY4326457.1 DMT family transporter [Paracoccaceae bacterium]
MIKLSQAARGHLVMFGFSLGIAGSFSLGSLIANQIDPVAVTVARFVLAVPLMGMFAAFSVGLKWKDAAQPWRYAIIGGLMAAYFVLMFEGLKTASPVSISVVFTLTPILSGIAGYVLLRQVIAPHSTFALALGAAGAAWVIFGADLESLLAFRMGTGEAIFLIGCICHGLSTPLQRLFNRGESPIVFVLGTMIAGAVLMLIYGRKEVAAIDWVSLPAIVWMTIGYLTVVSTALTFVAVNYAAMRLPSAKVMAYTYLTPSWVIVWEATLGHGFPRFAVIAGIAAAAAAMLILLRHDTD